MRAEQKNRAVFALAAVAALTLFVGCRIPGGSFGDEPLQTRFAALTRNAAEAGTEPRPQERAVPPMRVTQDEPVVIAGKADEGRASVGL